MTGGDIVDDSLLNLHGWVPISLVTIISGEYFDYCNWELLVSMSNVVDIVFVLYTSLLSSFLTILWKLWSLFYI